MEEVPAGATPLRAWRFRRGTSVRRATGVPLFMRVLQIWDRRDVLRMFVIRELKVKYASSVLGYAWSLIEPALLISVYFVLFGQVFHARYPQYPLFIASTMLPWLWFSGTLNGSTGALRSNGKLITSVALPREIYPLATVGEKAVEFLFSLPVVIIVAAIYRVPPSRYLAALPLAMLLQLLLVTGFALFISSMNTILRDIQRGLGVVLRVLFYMTPVLYPVTRLHGTIRRVYECNPLVGIFELHRAVWYPKYFLNWHMVVYSAIGSVAIFAIGWFTFIRLERTVLKEL